MAEADRAAPSRLRASLLGSVVWSLLTRVATLPLGLIQGAILARHLHPAGLGRYSALLTDVNLLVLFLSLGMPGALAVLIGERPQRLRRLLRLALGFGAVAVLLPGLVVAVLAGVLPVPAAIPRTGIELRLLALATTCQYVRDVLNSLLWGTQQFQAQSWQSLLMVVAQLGVVAGLAATGALDPQAAVAVQIGANLLLVGLAAGSLWRLSRDAGLWVPAQDGDAADPLLLRAAQIGARGMLHMLPGLLLMRVDVYLIQRLMPPGGAQHELGIYQAGVRIGEMILMVPGTLNSVLFAKAAAREDVVGTTVACAKISLYLGLFCCVGMALVGQPILMLLYGPQYAGSFWPCVLVLLGCCGFCLSTPLTGTLAGDAGFPRSIILAEVIALAVNVLANLYLIPRHGVVGAAAASTVSYFVSAAVLTAAFRARYGVPVIELLRPEGPAGLVRRVRGV